MSRKKEEGPSRLRMLGDRLRDLREQQAIKTGRKVYQRNAARICGIKEDAYRAYEYGRAQLPETCAKALAAEWGIHWHDFYSLPRKNSEDITGFQRNDRILNRSEDEVGPPRIPGVVLAVPLPFLGYIAASSKVNWTDPFDAVEMEYVPAEMGARGRFCCRIKGDSCYPELWPDDLVVFQSHEAPKIGSIVVHRSPENLVTVKQLKHNGQGYLLHPLNPLYQDEPASGVIVGALVGLVRKFSTLTITIYKDGEPLTRADLGIFQVPS